MLFLENEKINPLNPMSDQDIISPYNINQIRDEDKEKISIWG